MCGSCTCPPVAVWRLGLSLWPRAALSGLAAIIVYAPYDIIGAKFLWWTWHDTDGPIVNRLLGVPIGSTMWVITFVATFAWLMGRVLDRDREVSRRTCAIALGLVASLTTVIMVVQITALQQLDGGVPGMRGLIVITLVFAGLAAAGWRGRVRSAPSLHDGTLLGAAGVYFVTLTLCMALFRPETHQSASAHQTVGACYVEGDRHHGHDASQVFVPRRLRRGLLVRLHRAARRWGRLVHGVRTSAQ